MDSNLTEVRIILDASASMRDLQATTISQLNEFIQDQQAVPGKLRLSIYQFNTLLRQVLPPTDIREVNLLTREDYTPTGMTALLDAVGDVIDQTGDDLRKLPEYRRPGRVLLMIVTDGQENSSRKFTLDDIASKIEHQKSKYNWDFSFMGANIDSFGEAGKLGIAAASTVNFEATHRGLEAAFALNSKSVSRYRTAEIGTAFSYSDDK